MAPYTMTIHIQNDTDQNLELIGSSNLSPLDGSTKVDADLNIGPNQRGKVWISKSGGTDGLFTLVSYDFPSRSDGVMVYAMMSAAPMTPAKVYMVDHTARNQPQLTDNSSSGAATSWYQDKKIDRTWSSNAVEMKWGIMGKEWKYQPGAGDQEVWRITRTLTKDSMKFPDSSCTVEVTSQSIGRMNWNLDQYDRKYDA